MPTKTYNQILDEHLYILVAQGNHEAFIKFSKRYHKHAVNLATELFRQYPNSGITRSELITVCESYFPIVLKKYITGISSFYTFWKESTLKEAMDYIIDNSYEGKAAVFRGAFSLDQNYDDKHLYGDFLAEKDDSKLYVKRVKEIKRILNKYDVFFTPIEKAIINLTLEGYSIVELEHSGLLKKSQLYLTYQSALGKLQSYMNEDN